MGRNPRLLSPLLLLVACTLAVAGEQALTFQDLMKFRQVRNPVISQQGNWIAYQLEPDRGDGEAVVRQADGSAVFRIERGAGPKLSSDSAWVAAAVLPTQEDRDKASGKKDEKDKPKKGMALLRTSDGSVQAFERVKSFSFSEDGAWLAYQRYKEEEEEEKKDGEEGEEETVEEIVIRHLLCV